MWTMRMRFKDILAERNITQKKLAEMTGLSEPAISEIVNGLRSAIHKENFCKVAKALDIDDMNKLLVFVKD